MGSDDCRPAATVRAARAPGARRRPPPAWPALLLGLTTALGVGAASPEGRLQPTQGRAAVAPIPQSQARGWLQLDTEQRRDREQRPPMDLAPRRDRDALERSQRLRLRALEQRQAWERMAEQRRRRPPPVPEAGPVPRRGADFGREQRARDGQRLDFARERAAPDFRRR